MRSTALVLCTLVLVGCATRSDVDRKIAVKRRRRQKIESVAGRSKHAGQDPADGERTPSRPSAAEARAAREAGVLAKGSGVTGSPAPRTAFASAGLSTSAGDAQKAFDGLLKVKESAVGGTSRSGTHRRHRTASTTTAGSASRRAVAPLPVANTACRRSHCHDS